MPELSNAELAEQYGFVSGLLNSNPELKKLFAAAVKGGWSSDKFQAKLRNTKWWKTHSKEERDYLIELKSDPATAKEELNEAKVKARQIAEQLGVRIGSYTMGKIQQAAYNMVAKGWDESQLRNYLGRYIHLDSNIHQGEAGEVWDELKGYAYSMGVTMSEKWFTDAARNAVRGIASIQDFKNSIQNKAIAQFPQWSEQIKGGQSVMDVANPYMQSMAQILELPAGSINLFDPTIKRALSYTNPSTMTKEAKPLWQFENELRSDPRWKQTKNAQDSMFQVGHQVLADFGLTF